MKEFLNSQTALILTLVSGALGYLIRYFFESKSKRQFRKFELFEELKIKAITSFIENYHITYDYMSNDLIKEDFDTTDVLKKLHHSYYVAKSYCTKKESEVFQKIFINLNDHARSCKMMHDVIFKKTDKKLADVLSDPKKMIEKLAETRKQMDNLIQQNLAYYR